MFSTFLLYSKKDFDFPVLCISTNLKLTSVKYECKYGTLNAGKKKIFVLFKIFL